MTGIFFLKFSKYVKICKNAAKLPIKFLEVRYKQDASYPIGIIFCCLVTTLLFSQNLCHLCSAIFQLPDLKVIEYDKNAENKYFSLNEPLNGIYLLFKNDLISKI